MNLLNNQKLKNKKVKNLKIILKSTSSKVKNKNLKFLINPK